MANAVTIARLPEQRGTKLPAAELGAGWWWAPSCGAPGEVGRFDLCIRTPHGDLGRIVTRLHRVDPRGVVTPSIEFRWGKGWHVMGTLAGWTAEDAARPRT